jgi:hypothetical protein
MELNAFCLCGAYFRVISDPATAKELVESFWREHRGEGHGRVSEKECNERRRGEDRRRN